MNEAAVRQVRSFNRFVTQRIGALDDEYLSRQRSLGASRVLWEVGEEGTDARALRTRLELDSGYLSRMLRSLEDDGLVTVDVDPRDKRVRTVRLTTAGIKERHLLDRRSDALAWSLLAALSASQQERLITAMGVVERLLTAGLVEIAVEDPASEVARFCIRSYLAELDTRLRDGFDQQRSLAVDENDLVPPRGLLMVARLRNEPVGCGALKLRGTETAEVKRMWVAPGVRGLGVGRRILGELEAHALELGVRCLRLDTNRTLSEAIALYRSAGYEEVEAFNDEPYAHHWFEKHLGPPPPAAHRT